MSDFDDAMGYLFRCLGAPYIWWNWSDPDIPVRSPAWAENAPAPYASEVVAEGCFCAGVPNLLIRCLIWLGYDIEIPGYYEGDEPWDGGVLAYQNNYWAASEWFDENADYPDFTLLLKEYAEGYSQGHVALVYQGRVLDSTDSGGGWPGVAYGKSVLESNAWIGGYTVAIRPEAWLPALPQTPEVPTEQPSDAAALIDPYLGGHGAVIVAEAQRADMDLSLACALVEQESNGLNIFGCDFGDVGDAPPYCGQDVTYERVQALRDGGNYSFGMNGVGLTQLTYYTFVEEAESLGGAHLPENQCRVGFGILENYLDDYPYLEAIAAYNAGEANRFSVMDTYAASVAAKDEGWKSYLADAVLPPDKPPEKEAGLTWSKYTFAAIGQPYVSFTNAAVAALEEAGVDAGAHNGETNIVALARDANSRNDVSVLNCVVVGKAAYDALEVAEKARYGWTSDTPIWAVSGDTEAMVLKKVRDWALGWIAEYGEGLEGGKVALVQRFEDVLLAMNHGRYAPLLAEVDTPEMPDPPEPPRPPMTLEETVEDHEERITALEGSK